jgi:arylsulfatase A-like enzyme
MVHMPELIAAVPNVRALPTRSSPDIDKRRYRSTHTVALPLLCSIWLGIVAGLVEGFGLLLFQNLNWRRWGLYVHVSKEILWISPVADTVVFAFLALLLTTGALLVRRSAVRITIFLLAFLAVYDWLSLTERLYYRACVLLAIGISAAFLRWFNQHQGQVARFCRRNLVWLLGTWLVVFLAIQCTNWLREDHALAGLPAARPGVPNVIVIVVDTLRADHVSAYGYQRLTTPNLDRIARQGVLFENAMSACSWTLPSHASLLTGRYPQDHGLQSIQPTPLFRQRSLRGYPTIGEALERIGYRTAAFSANQTYFTSSVGLGRGFIRFEDYFESPRDMFMRTFFGRDRLIGATRDVMGFRSWLYTHKDAAKVNRELFSWVGKSPRPFFAFLNYIDVHDADRLSWKNVVPAWGLKDPISRYDSALTYEDTQIGELMLELDRHGLAKNTLVIITSDHGESLGQHHMWSHGAALYLEEIHVPLFLWYPGHIPAGGRITIPVSNAAIPATIMRLDTGTSSPFPGPALTPLWSDKNMDVDRLSPVSELATNAFISTEDRQATAFVPTAFDGDMKSILTSRWHLIVHETRGKRLFDWVNDPGELKNLIDTPQGQAAAKHLSTEIQTDTSP